MSTPVRTPEWRGLTVERIKTILAGAIERNKYLSLFRDTVDDFALALYTEVERERERHDRHLAYCAGVVFSRHIDALGELEKVELADEILQEAGINHDEPGAPPYAELFKESEQHRQRADAAEARVKEFKETEKFYHAVNKEWLAKTTLIETLENRVKELESRAEEPHRPDGTAHVVSRQDLNTRLATLTAENEQLHKTCADFDQFMSRADAENARMRELIRWVLGEVGEWSERPIGSGNFYWRTELRRRFAALSPAPQGGA